MAKISKNIKRLRTNANMSQDELAQKLFISRQAVSSWEVGRTQPDIEMIGKLSEIFSVPTEEIIYGEKRNTALAESVRTKKTLSMIFAVLGSLLVGVGIMIILIGLWEDFSNIIKSIVSLIPLLIGQGVAVYVYRKKFDSIMWREGGAVLWSVGVIATVGLMSMVNQLYLGVTTCLLIDAIMILPILYVFRVVSPLPFYYGFSIAGVVGIMDDMSLTSSGELANNLSFIVYVLLSVILIGGGVFVMYINRKKISENAIDISIWSTAVAVTASVVLAMITGEGCYGMIMCLFAALYALCKKNTWLQPFHPLGVAGTCIASLIYTVFSSDAVVMFGEFSKDIFDVPFFGGIIVSIAIISAGFILGRKNIEEQPLKLAFCCTAAAMGVVLNLIEIPFVAKISSVIIFVLTFIEGAILIIKGATDKSYFTMNVGIITILVLMFQILTLVEFTLITVGLMLLLSGGSLLGANIYISKQIKKDQAELAARAVEIDE